MPLAPGPSLFRPRPPARGPRPLAWPLPSPSEWTEDVGLPDVIGGRCCHSGGRRGLQRRGPPPPDGDWTRPSGAGLGWAREGPRRPGALGPGAGAAAAPRSCACRRGPPAEGRVEGRSGGGGGGWSRVGRGGPGVGGRTGSGLRPASASGEEAGAGVPEGVRAPGTGCGGEAAALLGTAAGGSSDGSPTVLPFELPEREPPWSLLAFWEPRLWARSSTCCSLIGLPSAFPDTGRERGEYVRKQEAAAGLRGQTPGGTAPGNSGKTHCPLCMGLFKAPRLLPCLHTVCTTCLEQLEPFSVVDIRGGDSDTSSEGSIFQELKPPSLQPQIGILCPVCDAQVDLPMGGVKALTIDHLAMNDVMLESLRGEGQGLVCDLCSDRKVEKRCQTCKANLCHFCCQAHRRQKKTTYHTMVDLKDLKGYSRLGKPILCPAHPAEELRLFCELCDRPVCRDCVVGEHRGHPYDFTSNVIHKHGDSVRELLRGTQPHVEALEEALAQIRGTNTALQKRVEAVAADVRTFSEGYIKAIEEHRDKLLKQLEDIRVQKENSLQLQKAQLEQLLADMRTGVEFTEHLLTSGSDLEILITKGVVVERLTKLNKVEYSTHPGVNDKICFSPQQKAGRCHGYEVYGAINTKEVDPAKCVLQGEDLHRAREKQTASFTLLCKDSAGESMGRGGDSVQVAVVPKDKKDSPVRTLVQDNKDGSYYISYTPKEPGVYTVLVCIKEQHVQGSPFTVTVRKRHRPHPGVFHCCTFCSSGGQKTARCACGGTMPGGYLGCGHGHKGHPGRPHWSCCGKVTEKSECTWTGGQSAPRSLLRTVAL